MQRVLIANRGEIAIRIMKTLRRMGVTTCAIYSQQDEGSMHWRVADEAYLLEGDDLASTYLDQDQIVELCQRHKIGGVHPGYGFLAENAGFARRLEEVGVTFIGPGVRAIESMGDKLVAKEAMRQAGVPVVPSWQGDLKGVLEGARGVGYPLLVKAAAGGGGKGMRLVEKESELEEAVERASSEALKAFGDGTVFLERYITEPRHIEIQILGDRQGNVVHLGERECSLQRRFQKIVEESPSSAVSPEVRQKMGQAALLAAKAIDYHNAGTVEFIMSKEGEFFFLEVNTRLQVEHPVTEHVYGLDLVEWQVRIARGETLRFNQETLSPRGWSFECRVYAEDPENQYMPSTGRIVVYQEPNGSGIRVDSAVREGSIVTSFFDPMIAKVITWGEDREQARQKMALALSQMVLLGVKSNLHQLQNIMQDENFIKGEISTLFLEQNPHLQETQELPLAGLATASLEQSQEGAKGAVSSGERQEMIWQQIRWEAP